MRLLMAGLVVLIASGCGAKAGFLRDAATVTQFQYKMDITTVEHKRTASGTASVGLILCAIPISGEYYKRAMEDLHSKASLQSNEVLSNFREDHAFTTFLGFYCTQEVTVSADIVKLNGANAPAAVGP